MIRLNDGMILYHGSYTEVSQINLCRCEAGKDFGQGFYLTSSFAQAQHFIPLSVKKYNFSHRKAPIDITDGRVSVYRLHLTDCDLKLHYFDTTDEHWLHFISCNRKKGLFPELIKQYKDFDVISGKIANDKTSTVIAAYIGGAYGAVEDQAAVDSAIRFLLPNKLEDQYCFLTDRSIAALEFIRSEPYDPSI